MRLRPVHPLFPGGAVPVLQGPKQDDGRGTGKEEEIRQHGGLPQIDFRASFQVGSDGHVPGCLEDDRRAHIEEDVRFGIHKEDRFRKVYTLRLQIGMSPGYGTYRL